MKLKNNLFRSTAAIIATLLALSFTGCGQNPIISESPSSTGVVSESTASSEQTAGGSVDGSFTIHFILLWLFSIPTNFSARPFPKPSSAPLRFGRLQSVQTASTCRFRQAACTTAYRTKTCRTAITLRSNSATCLRRSKSFCRLLKTTRHRWLRSTGMCP